MLSFFSAKISSVWVANGGHVAVVVLAIENPAIVVAFVGLLMLWTSYMWTHLLHKRQRTVISVWTTMGTNELGAHMGSGFHQSHTISGDQMAMGGTTMVMVAMAKLMVAKAKLLVARQMVAKAKLMGARQMVAKAMLLVARARVRVSQRTNL